MSTFVERLQETIGDQSASAFARKCGVPGTNIRSYLAGREPGLENLVKVCEKSGVMLDWLMTGRGVRLRADAAAVDLVAVLQEYAKGPWTHERLFEVMVIQVSHIQDPVLRETAMKALVSKRKEFDQLEGKKPAPGKKKKG